MIAPLMDPEIAKLACVLAFLVPAVMAGGVGFLWTGCFLIRKMFERRP